MEFFEKIIGVQLCFWISAERFISDDSTGGNLDHGLKDHFYRVLVEIILFVADMDFISPFFRNIKRAVGHIDQFVDRPAMLRIKGHADADVERDAGLIADMENTFPDS